jgi:hypothetical protein
LPVGLPAAVSLAGGGLVELLSIKPAVTAPSVFLSGLFRPPRAVP